MSVNFMLERYERLSTGEKTKLKRAFGQSFTNVDLGTKIAFAKISDAESGLHRDCVNFFIATSYAYYRENGGSPDTPTIKFQEFLRSIAQDKEVSASKTNDIDRLLKSKVDDNGYFVSHFRNFVLFSKKNPHFDYNALYWDLINWGIPDTFSGLTPNVKWAKAIYQVRSIPEEENN